MSTQYVLSLKDVRRGQHTGNKAERLHFLTKQGFHTPVTYVCTWDAYLRYLEDDSTLIQRVRSELAEILDLDRPYAVRSSANVEDSLDHSFAGQFKTVLNVEGIEEVLQAIWGIWATTKSDAVETYLKRNNLDPDNLRMAVLIQEMVPPAVSGVSFSKNPVTGLDEIIVEAVKGSGEALVQEGVTPQRWVNKWGNWIVTPETDDIQLDLIQEVVQQTKAIAKTYGQAVDLEWVYDGQALYWVQLREITSINLNLYSNRISREMSAGVLKPVVSDIGLIPTRSWARIFTELIGPNDIDPDNLAKAFYFRIYYNMGSIGQLLELLGLPRESIELMIGIEEVGPDKPSFKPSRKTYALIPRMVSFAIGKLRFSPKADAFLATAQEAQETFQIDNLVQLSERELLGEIDRLYSLVEEVAYYTIVTTLLMQIYTRLLKVRLSRLGVDFEHFDLTRGMDELKQFDPNIHLAKLSQGYRELDRDLQARISHSSYEEFCQLAKIKQLQRDVEQFREQFGYLRDSDIDFSMTPWQDNPDLILKMMVNYASAKDTSEEKVAFEDLNISGPQSRMLGPVYRRARRFTFYREAFGYLHKVGYGLFQPYFLALGDHFEKRDIIKAREDIYYLYFDEIRNVVANEDPGSNYQQKITDRKRELEACLDITPPTVIYGDQAPPLESHVSDKLKGTPTSRGQYTGPARVIQGIREFDKLEDGDVLIIPYSDVAWTPLFTRAGAVIAESGGMLSHSSIIAREYNIPAVVSVTGACRLKDNTVVTVDGYRGLIVIHESEEK